jgi:hypothetical protein
MQGRIARGHSHHVIGVALRIIMSWYARHGRVIEVPQPHRWVVHRNGRRPVYGIDAFLSTYKNFAAGTPRGRPMKRERGIYCPTKTGDARFHAVDDENDMHPQAQRQYKVAIRLMEILYQYLDETTLEMYEHIHTSAMFFMSTRPKVTWHTMNEMVLTLANSVDLTRVLITDYPVTRIVHPTVPPTCAPVEVYVDVEEPISLPV